MQTICGNKIDIKLNPFSVWGDEYNMSSMPLTFEVKHKTYKNYRTELKLS